MNLKEYADFANENRSCFLATTEGNQPRVRCLNMWFADETGFYFQAQTVKALCRQLQKNPKIEVCFAAKDFSRIMRVAGEVKFIDDLAMRKSASRIGLSLRTSESLSRIILCSRYSTCTLERPTSDFCRQHERRQDSESEVLDTGRAGTQEGRPTGDT